jgi:hypothetical protein
MIDTTAMILCILGFGLVSFGQSRAGFILSLLGSVFWLFFAMSINSTPLMLQSVAFATFSTVGLFRK